MGTAERLRRLAGVVLSVRWRPDHESAARATLQSAIEAVPQVTNTDSSQGFPTIPPEAGLPALRVAQAMRRPIERFLHIEAASGILLIIAAAAALIWANSPWAHSYESLWHTPLRIGIGEWTMEKSLHFWINDLLMSLFFLVAGLEIKREMVHGALSDIRRAALPLAAAIGGMLVPAAIYASLNMGGPGAHGWGVPMATDIAFAVGVLTILGRRVPPALRVLLLAFAVIDDLGAILVIAVFYTSSLAVDGLVLAAGGVFLTWLFGRMGVRPGAPLILPFLVIWAGLYRAGIHPSIDGVIVGLMVPARAWYGPTGFIRTARKALIEFEEKAEAGETGAALIEPLQEIGFASREAVAPVVRLEHQLHSWVAYGIMPLFALANAGVALGGVDFSEPGAFAVMSGVALGLLVGKPVGVLVCSWIAVRMGLCVLPQGVNWRGITVVGMAAAIGFTMAIFIAELAYGDPDLLSVAKIGVLVATAVAATLALVLGRIMLPAQPAAVADVGEGSVESTSEFWTVDGAAAAGTSGAGG
jgi:NhaA family Na+:H+ antiporter